MKKLFIFTLLIVSNFISWNFFGLSLIFTIGCFFYLIKGLYQRSWAERILNILCITFLFNLSSTFWLLEASWWEGLLAFIGNTVVMSIPILLIFFIKSKSNLYFSFTFLWMFFEILHTTWDLSWPWLSFGNSMGNLHTLIQWYSITGVYGGTFWLLTLGYLLFKIYELRKISIKRQLLLFSIFLFLPILASLLHYQIQEEESESQITTVTYIPNDSINTNYEKAKSLFFKTHEMKSTDLIIGSEIFFSKTNRQNLKNRKEGIYLSKIFKKLPNTKMMIGAELLNNKKELFNTVMLLDKEKMLFRTKKKYVPIREYTPRMLRKIIGNSFYTKNSTDNHTVILDSARIFPMLCYESIFSYFVAKKSLKAEAIILLASEEFMNGSFFGKKQYLNIVRLRAIENNRYILKCSTINGVSCLINEKGDIVKYIKNNIDYVEIPIIKESSIFQKIISLL